MDRADRRDGRVDMSDDAGSSPMTHYDDSEYERIMTIVNMNVALIVWTDCCRYGKVLLEVKCQTCELSCETCADTAEEVM
jgi:hypothetical protein